LWRKSEFLWRKKNISYHPAGQRIRKQDQWELEGHGQYVPPRLPPPQASISYATYGILYATILHTMS
jgi:hypothetical protein